MKHLQLKPLVLFLATIAAIGCAESYHDKVGWKAEAFFDDPKVVALCKAIEADDLGAMEAAVAAGADINAVGRDGMTPLLWAFPDHKVERFEWLLINGADPNICWTGDFGLGKNFVYRRGKSVMYLAFETQWPEYWRLVLDHGGDPNLSCDNQNSPLVHVAMEGWVPGKDDRLKALVDAGADINAARSTEDTPLIRAAAHGLYDRAEQLIQMGADIEAYQEDLNRQLVHYLVWQQQGAKRLRPGQEEAFLRVVKLVERHGVDFEKARQDIKRWESWAGKSRAEKKRLREQETADRQARLAKEAAAE